MTPAAIHSPGHTAFARVIATHQSRDVLRKRWVLWYALCLVLAGDLLLRLAGSAPSALVSLLNVVLLLVPLIALILGSASLYSAREFTELLLVQPIPRRTLYVGLYFGLTVPLLIATEIGIALPFVIERALDAATLPMLFMLMLISGLLVCVFTAIAFVITVRVRDRARGLGVAILVWLWLGLLYDGLVLAIATTFRDWPIERGMLVAMLLNPIDLARTILLLRLDVAALMGYTGAVFRLAFGSWTGQLLAFGVLIAWILAPWQLGARAFDRRDF